VNCVSLNAASIRKARRDLIAQFWPHAKQGQAAGDESRRQALSTRASPRWSTCSPDPGLLLDHDGFLMLARKQDESLISRFGA
jgi:hypothetical protein